MVPIRLKAAVSTSCCMVSSRRCTPKSCRDPVLVRTWAPLSGRFMEERL